MTAVDKSELLLQHVPEKATKVLADIEMLDLGRRFSVVLLASNLVNVAYCQIRLALLRGCRRHVAGNGQVIRQRYAPSFSGWDDRDWQKRGSIEVRIAAAERIDHEFTATLEYRAGARVWLHSFAAVIIDDADLGAEVADADLTLGRTLSADCSWIELRQLSTRS